MNKLFTKIAALALGMTMATGVGVAVATSSKANLAEAADGTTKYVLINSTDSLEADKSYIITNGTSGTVRAIATTANDNNRKTTEVTVSNGQITRGSSVMSFTLGGSSGAWTFKCENYATSGDLYLASAASGKNNYLRCFATAGTATISFSGDAAVITIGPHTSRNIIRYNPNNGSPIFACYSSGQQAIYLWKETSGSTKLATPSPNYDDANKQVKWDDITGASSYQVKVDSGDYATATSPYDVSGLTTGVQHTVYVKAIGDGTNYTDSDPGSKTFTPSVPTTIQSVSITGVVSPISSAIAKQTAPLTATATNATGTGVSTFTWASSDTTVATVDSSTGVITYIGDGSVNITATSNYPAAQGGSNVGTLPLTITGLKGTADNPLTVSEAISFIDTLGSSVANEMYVSGIVCQVDSYNSKYHSITYWISDDGTTTTKLEAYSGKGLESADFSSEDDLQVDDEVTICGNLKKYSGTPEFDMNNYLVSFYRPGAVELVSITISGSLENVDYETDESWSVTGLTVTATYDDESTEDVTDEVGWSFSPATPADMGTGTGSLTITATYNEKTDDTTATVTVTASAYSVSTLVVGTDPTTGSWANSVRTASVTHQGFTYSASEGGNNGKYYSNNTSWRLYQGDSGTLTITSTTYLIHSFTVTYDINNTGILVYNSTQYSSGEAIIVGDVSSVTFGVGNTTSATNGQVQVKRIQIKYFEKPEIESISISGSLTQDTYEVGVHDSWNTDGLTVTLHYKNSAAPDENVTAEVEWSFDPETPSSSSITSVDYTATYEGEKTLTDTETYEVTVNEPEPIVEDGKQYILAYPTNNYYFTGIVTSGSNKIGQATTYVAFPKTDHVLTAVDNNDGSFSFRLSDSKYLYWSSGNTLNENDSISNNSKWSLTKNLDNSVTIANVADSTRLLQFNAASGQQRFACYNTAQKHPMLIEVDDCALAGNFVECYMHVEIPTSETGESTGYSTCKGTGYYDVAKAQFNALSDEVREEFATNSKFADYYQRLLNWARANNDSFGSNNGDDYVLYKDSITPLTSIINNSGNTIAIIVIISIVSASAIGGYFFIRKRKEN